MNIIQFDYRQNPTLVQPSLDVKAKLVSGFKNYNCIADFSACLFDSSAAILSARGVSYLPMTTSTSCIFPALQNSGPSRSFSNPSLSRTVYDLDSVPSTSPRVVRSDVHFLTSLQHRNPIFAKETITNQLTMSLYFLSASQDWMLDKKDVTHLFMPCRFLSML